MMEECEIYHQSQCGGAVSRLMVLNDAGSIMYATKEGIDLTHIIIVPSVNIQVNQDIH